MRKETFLWILWLGCSDAPGGNEAEAEAESEAESEAEAEAEAESEAECETVEGTPDLGLELVVDGLDFPVDLQAPPGDERLFVVQQTGEILIIENGDKLDLPFLDLSDRTSTHPASYDERGLLGMAFHPEYATNGLFYVNYTGRDGECNVVSDGCDTHIEEFRVSSDSYLAESEATRVLLTQDQPVWNHNGGGLAFGPDGRLYAGLGDGGSACDPSGNGQDDSTALAKLLRIDVDSKAAKVSNCNTGLRNPWRFSFDRETGDLYIGDVGQGEWEEIDVVAAQSICGNNFGWNICEGSHLANCGSKGDCGGALVDPVAEYDHGDGVSVTGGYVYRGCRMPDWHGTYFYADFGSGFVRSFRWDGDSGVVEEQEWDSLSDDSSAPSSFGQDAQGELYLVKYHEGAVYKIVPVP